MIYAISIAAILFIALIFQKADKVAEAKKTKFGRAGEHLGYFNRGFSLAGGLRATTRDQAFRGSLIVGTTGSGKTAAVLTSTLFSLARSKCSVVILDVSGENFKTCSGYLAKKKNRKIYCLDFSSESDGFNPFALCRSINDLDKVAHVLVKNSGVESKSDPYWSTSCELVISMLMQYLFYYGQEEHKNMANVVLLLETFMADPVKTDVLFYKTGDARLMKTYRTINAIPEKTRQSILATAFSALRLFKTPSVARCTAVNTFSMVEFRKEPSVLFLCIPLNQVNFLAPLSAVLFEMLFQEVLSKLPDREKDLPIFFLIDEMMTMKLDLGLVFSNCRKYMCGIMGLLQDEKMLGMKYTYAESYAIKSNACSKVYLPGGLSLETCKELQEIIGKCTVKEEDGRERQIYAMEASEIRSFDKAIILVNSALPVVAKIRPYFNHFWLNPKTKVPPFVPTRKIPFEEPALMEIDE